MAGECVNSCEGDTVLVDGVCTCEGDCLTCKGISTYCLSCGSGLILYNHQCLSVCPPSTYNTTSDCFDCDTGCLECSRNACFECLPGYNTYNNGCYSSCSSLGDGFTAIDGACFKCPQGCFDCDADSACSVCLSAYTLNGTICI